jgi:gluconate kinase
MDTSSPALRLDLSRAPSVLYFYGLAGAGKSYVAELVGRLAGWHVYDADEDLTPELRQALAEKRHFTVEMRDRFFVVVSSRIIELAKTHDRLAVSQATYRRRHREYLTSHIPGLELIWVRARDETIMNRLRRRGGEVTPEYATLMKLGFEPPPAGAKILENDGGEAEVVSQLNRMYGAVGEEPR